MSKRKEIRLSPSRVNSINDCSWQYYASYHLRLPRFGNDGSKRGTICHAVLECLVKKNHRHYVDKLIQSGDIFQFPAIAKYVEMLAVREKLPLDQVVINKDKNGLMTHREEINNMILVGLKTDFLGEPGAEILSEIKHTVEVYTGDKKSDKKFCILGIIDKVLVYRDKDGKILKVKIVDYKTSSKKFDEEDLESNLQGLVYQLFAKKMFPGVKDVSFEFHFLRFPKSPVLSVPALPDSDVDGLEHYLTYISRYMSAFTEEHAKKNFAKYSQTSMFLCGRYGNKKYYDKVKKVKVEHNEPQFICALRDPFNYYAVIDEDGNNVRSELTREELKAKDGEVVVKRRYGGCPSWHAQKRNLQRDWTALQ